jgi:hypothetical protein
MARRPAAAHIHFVEVGRCEAGVGIMREYAVEVRRGRTRFTIGRVYGGHGQWNALPVGHVTGWTRWHRTRAAATLALMVRESCTDARTWVTPDAMTRVQRAVAYARAVTPIAGVVRYLPAAAAPAADRVAPVVDLAAAA